MAKYLITGRPGSGKTTVIRELQRRGYTAYDTDTLDDITKLEVQRTKEIVPWPNGPVDWSNYIWNWQDVALRKLLDQDGKIFLGAIVGNQKDYYPLFDKIFALIISGKTLEHRLASHEHRRTQEEIDKAIIIHDEKQARWKDHGLILIPAEKPVIEVVDNILSQL